MSQHRTATFTVTSAAAIALLAACSKAPEAVAEKMAEKAIESSMSKDGTQAKVNLSEGAIKVTTTDAAGKTTQLEIGQAQVSETDVGLPFYPGSKPAEGGSTRMVAGDTSTFQVGLQSADAPDKVAAFYRDRLKAMSAGKQLMDMSSNDGASLSLIDDKAKHSLQVHVSKTDKGSDITIQSTRSGDK